MTAEMKTSILDIRKRPLRRWHPHARRLIYLKRRASNLRNGYTFRYLIVAPARRRDLCYWHALSCPPWDQRFVPAPPDVVEAVEPSNQRERAFTGVARSAIFNINTGAVSLPL